jgi:hypothetical protein
MAVWRRAIVWPAAIAALTLFVSTPARMAAQTGASETTSAATDEDYHAYNDSPRLLLTRQRLRLLQRERERRSMRWEQFDALVTGGAAMPEPGMALALYYRVAGNAQSGQRALDWALSEGSDLRQLSLVFDWCGPLMTPMQADRLGQKIEQAMSVPATDIRRQDARVLAAIAIADRLPDHGESVLRGVVQEWWRGDIVRRLKAGEPAIPRDQAYPLYELMHAIRDNLKIDLRESHPNYFKSYPLDHLMGHYPSALDAPENEYRVPVYLHNGDPDIADAVSSRAAELAMVAFDDNASESQYLQGWLMQDRFLMRGALGAAYEFMWANPYQPGLSYTLLPLVYHDAATGHVFARTNWDEDATWIGYFDGRLQLFQNGQIQTLKAGSATKPVRIGGAVLMSAANQENLKLHADSGTLLLLGLKSNAHYDVEVDDEELSEAETDTGGTLVLNFPDGADSGVRIRRRKD